MGAGGGISLAGRVAIVTGGGRGLGRAYALDLAARGAAVVVNSTSATADAVAAEIVAAGGRAVADVRSVVDDGAAEALVGLALDAFGRLDAVVASAGTVVNAPLAETSLAILDGLYRIHLRAPYALVQAALPHLASSGRGRVVLVSSASGTFGLPGQSAYGACKAAVLGLTAVAALELAEAGVHVNAVLPIALTNPGRTAASARLGELLGDRAASLSAAHVAGLVTFLCSDACTLTGRAFSAVAGRVAEVATGVGAGWAAPPGVVPSADDVAAHLDEILGTRELAVPGSLLGEIEAVAAAPATQ